MSWEPEIVKTVDLGYDQMMVIESHRGSVIRVVHGGVWLTEEGMARDVFAQSGEEIPLEGDGRALVQGLGYARVQFVEPRGPGATVRSVAARIGSALHRTLVAMRERGQLTARSTA